MGNTEISVYLMATASLHTDGGGRTVYTECFNEFAVIVTGIFCK
jgi:hypothetical protein